LKESGEKQIAGIKEDIKFLERNNIAIINSQKFIVEALVHKLTNSKVYGLKEE
jgi:hypothetical protein